MTRPQLAIAHVHSGAVRECFNMSRLAMFLHELARSADDDGEATPPFIIAEYCATDRLVDARNETVRGFLDHSPCEWLLTIDSDMGFPPDTAERLLASADPVERPIMGALCFAQKPVYADPLTQARQFQTYPTLFTWHEFPDRVGVHAMYDYPQDAVVLVSATGAACFLVHRSVLEAMREKYGDQWFTKIKHPTPAPHGTEFSEDLSFFLKAQACDFPVHVDTSVKTCHDKGGVFLDEGLYLARRAPRGADNQERISILLPSRGRPEQLTEMVSSAYMLADRPDQLEVVVRFDDDDTSTYPAIPGADVKTITGPRTLLSDCWNECYEKASGDILMHAGDDIRFRTSGWDTLVRSTFAEYPDRIAFIYGRDGFQDERLGTHGFIHRRWVDTVGYFVPPKFSSDFNDTWLNEVAERIGRLRFLPDLYTEHLHPAAGKGELDATHRERLERHRQDRPEVIYEQTEAERVADAEKLRAVMS